MHGSLLDGRQLHLDQRVDAAGAVRRAVDDHAARLLGIGAGIDFLSGHGGRVGNADQRGAAFQLAQILAARDNFLPRIATLLEIDAAQQLKIDHLRYELFLRALVICGMPA